VLINGASGGVGTYAVQVAKSLGAEVTGVCSTKNVALVRSLGADHVIDYTAENFTQGTQRYDLILDTVGNHTLTELRGSLTPHGALVMVGGSKGGPWLGPLSGAIGALVVSPFVSQKLVFMLAQMKQDDLSTLAKMMQDGKLTSIIDRHYPLDQVPAAIAYVEQGHAKGKVIVDVAP
jgi:NADPH:quinone reductase-like Zn-dependent oxidoreductase